MKWQKFTEQWPKGVGDNPFLYYHHAHERIYIAYTGVSGELYKLGFDCAECLEEENGCLCEVEIDFDNDFWMNLPANPIQDK